MGRVRLSSICTAAIFIMTAIMMRGDLFFVSNENTHENILRFIVLLMAVGIFMLIVCFSSKSLKMPEYHFARIYSFVIMAIGLFFWLFTSHLYSYTLYQSFALSTRFLYVFISVPIVYILTHKKWNRYFLDAVFTIFMVFLVVRFLAWLSFNYLPFQLFSNFAGEYGDWARNGLKRMVGGQLFGIGFVIATTKLASRRSLDIIRIGKLRNRILPIAFIVFYGVFVTQSRYAAVVLLVSIFTTYYFTRRKLTSKMSLAFFALGCVAFLIIGGILPEFISSFSVNSQYGEGTLSRLMGMQHFWNLFRTIGKNIGLGFIVNGYGTEDLFVWEARSWLNFYIGDLGIVGCFFRYGIFVIPVYGWLFVKMIKLAYRSIKMKSVYSALLVSMAVYFILSSIMSDQYDPSLAFSTPFYVAILSYVEPKLFARGSRVNSLAVHTLEQS